MYLKKIVETFNSMGISVFDTRIVRPNGHFYGVTIDNSYLTEKQIQEILALPYFVKLGVSWTYSIPRVDILIDGSKIQ